MSINTEPIPCIVVEGGANLEKSQAPSHSFYFHKEGNFVDGESIAKGISYSQESILVIDQPFIDNQLRPKYLQLVASCSEVLPQQDFFPNGLSRQQYSEILATQETIFRFNGESPSEDSPARNMTHYAEQQEGTANLSSFEKKGAITCVESAALTQQLLSESQKMTYVSGLADLNDSKVFEPHSFNLIETADKQYAAAILDIANPIIVSQEGGTPKFKPYCAPITSEQLKNFQNNGVLEINYGGEKRSYKSGPFLW